MDMSVAPRKYQQHPVARKRQIVQESLQPGVSVAVLARTHGINANQIWAWRKLYKQGRLGPMAGDEISVGASPALLAVDLVDAPPAPMSSQPCYGKLEIAVGRGKVCVTGRVDPALLAAALVALMS
jgi:transposase